MRLDCTVVKLPSLHIATISDDEVNSAIPARIIFSVTQNSAALVTKMETGQKAQQNIREEKQL